MELFIAIVTSAVRNINPSIFHMVYEPVFFIDTATVFTLQVACEGFGFPDTLQTTIALNILNEPIDALSCFLSCVCQ